MLVEVPVEAFTPTETLAETPNALAPTFVLVDTPTLTLSDLDAVRESEYPVCSDCPIDVELLMLLDVPVVLEEFHPLLTVFDRELEELVPIVSDDPWLTEELCDVPTFVLLPTLWDSETDVPKPWL